jgi:hypothetical protein
MADLIDHMNAKDNVWFATLAEIARHAQDLIHRGAWAPEIEKIPFWPKPVPADRAAEPFREVWSF